VCNSKSGISLSLKIKKRLILSITTGLAILIAGISANHNTSTISTSANREVIVTELPAPVIVKVDHLQTKKTDTSSAPKRVVVRVEDKVREFFYDIPELVYVAKCESQFRQHTPDGQVLRGRVNSLDVGVMQINEYYHKEESKKRGFDIYTLNGNMAYAKWLYEKEGLTPWLSSSPCWGKHVAAIASVN
jgi:hypothetical protein